MTRCSVRQVDKVGRVVLPREFRKHLGLQDGFTEMSISLHGEKLILEKHEPSKMNLLDQVVGLIETEIEYQQYRNPSAASVLINLLNQIRG